MASGIDMTLEDLIKKSKQSKPTTRVCPNRPSSASVPGPTRRNSKRRAARPAPYNIAPQTEAPEGTWQHDLFASHAAAYPAQVAPASAIETGTKLYISNLDYGVSNEDIKELFSEVGDLKRFGVHYDRSGRSKGMADVVFSRRPDALAAVKRYNNVLLDGKPMKIEIVGTNIATPAHAAPTSFARSTNQNGTSQRCQEKLAEKIKAITVPLYLDKKERDRGTVRAIEHPRGGGRGARRGRGGEQGKGRGEKVSLEDLDADLEKYHAEAMETS